MVGAYYVNYHFTYDFMREELFKTNAVLPEEKEEKAGLDTLVNELAQAQDKDLYNRAEKMMREDLLFTNPDFNRKEFVQALYTNEHYLTRALKYYTGMSIQDYIVHYRIDYAHTCLLIPDARSIEEIALASGFSSVRSFNRNFSEVFGMTPHKYRKEHNFSVFVRSFPPFFSSFAHCLILKQNNMAENKEEQIILRIETYDNILTEKEGDYTAKPIVTGSVGNPQIAKRIMKGGLEVREETILYILDMADQAKAEAIAQGISVNDGVGQYLVNTRGSFDGPSAAFNPQIHSLGVTYTIGKTLAALLKKIKVENRGLASLGPVINKVTDSTTLSENDEITPGAPITIEGKNMRVIGEDASVGLFFTPTAGGEAKKVSLFVQNDPSKIICVVPALSNGTYTMSITTQAGSTNRTVKTPRSCTFPVTLRVGPKESGGGDRPEIE